MKKKQTFQLYGIFGYPLSHTLSPAMHEAAFQKLGINANYIVMELADSEFQRLMKSASQLILSGFNVTVPYKERVMKYLDRVSSEARAIGAVNTVYRRGKRWVGTNTDMPGFLMTLKNDGGFRPSGKKAVILGAGGAARAVAYGLSREGVREILIADCFPKKAQKIIYEMRKVFTKIRYQAAMAGDSVVKEAVFGADVIINATPLGLKSGDALVIPENWIPKAGKRKKFFMDLIYNPGETLFLKTAKRKGHKTLNGLGMLLYQGALAFECWTRRKAPVSVMRQALLKALREKGK